MATIEELVAALRRTAVPGMKPKALRAAIRERYPAATKKEIVRAAFLAVAEAGSAKADGVAELPGSALVERMAGDEADTITSAKKRKKKPRSSDKDNDRRTDA